MTIDEAITKAREKAKEQKSKYDKCPKRMKYDCGMCFHEHKCNKIAEECEKLVEWLEELKTYRAIGTPEECRAAVEKQKAKKPLGGKDIDGKEYDICRECSAIVSDGDWHAEYCPDCGQKVDWKND